MFVLIDFKKHVAYAIWIGKEMDSLKCRNNYGQLHVEGVKKEAKT